MKKWPIRRMKLAELNPAPYNPRNMTERAREGLRESIDRFGMVEPVVWNKRTGNVVGGHQRLKCLLGEGVAEADVVVVDMPAEEEMALNITLNNPAVEGDFNEKLKGVLEGVDEKTRKSLDFDFLEEFAEMGGGGKMPSEGVREIDLSELTKDCSEKCPGCGFVWKPDFRDQCDVEGE